MRLERLHEIKERITKVPEWQLKKLELAGELKQGLGLLYEQNQQVIEYLEKIYLNLEVIKAMKEKEFINPNQCQCH